MERFVQVGVTSQRTIDGDFLPSVPLYIKVNEENENDGGVAECEKEMLHKIAELFAYKSTEFDICQKSSKK